MKKFILFTSILIAFTSCTNNDDDSNDTIDPPIEDPKPQPPVEDNKTLILGNWKYDKVEIINKETGQTTNDSFDDCTKKSNMTFYDNGNYINNYYEFFDNKCNYSQELTKYSIQDDRLLLTFEEADRNEFRIYKITKEELVLESDEDGDDIIYRDYYKK